MKRFSDVFIILCIALACCCKEKPAEQTPDKPTENTKQPEPAARLPFVPPADSVITPAQMKSWRDCNALLDSLTFRYADSFKTQDPAELMRHQENFISAQDKICIRAGLPGGYQEYKWILQNMGIEKNRKVLESANARTF